MVRYFIFAFIYILSFFVFSAEIVLSLFMLQCIFEIYEDVQKKSLSLLTMLYLSSLILTYANFVFVSNVGIVTSVYYYVAPAYIPEACLIWCLSSNSMFAGYKSFSKKSLPVISVDISSRTLSKIYYISVIISLSSLTKSTINLSFLGSFGDKFLTLLLIFSIMMFARLWTKEKNKKYRLYALSLCVLNVYCALKFAYVRGMILLPIISLMAGYFLGLGKVKYIFTYRILPYIIIFILFFQVFKQLSFYRTHFIDAFYATEERTSDDDDIPDINESESDESKGGAIDRLSNIAQITNCIKLTKLKGFYAGKASEPLVIAIIPRIFWPEKPQISLGTWFAIEIGIAYVNDEGHANNSVNMTIPGELYLDFGWIGVIIGCFLVGCLLALFWNSAGFGVSAYDLTGTLWGGYLLSSVLSNIGADLQIIITFFSTYLLFYVLKKSFGNTKRPGSLAVA